jgi:hypothetical protein
MRHSRHYLLAEHDVPYVNMTAEELERQIQVAMPRPLDTGEESSRSGLRATRLAEVPRKVRDESMRVNADFAAIERDSNAESHGV